MDDSAATAPAFGAKQALGIFFAYLGLQLAFGIAAATVVGILHGARLAHGAPPDLLRRAVLWGAFLGLAGSGALTAWITWRMRGRSIEGLRPFGWRASGARAAWTGAALGAACAIAFLALFVAFPPPPDFRPGPLRNALDHGGSAALAGWTLLAIGVAPPVEEFVFRGVLWTGLRESWGPVPAAIATTLLFVGLHLLEAWRYPPALAAIGVMGLVALAVRVRNASLVPAICVHAAYNAVVALASLAGSVAR